MNPPIVQSLGVSEEEIKRVTSNINFMLQVKKENNLKEEYLTKIFGEWKIIANRLTKGRSMVEQMYQMNTNHIGLLEDRRFNSLINLYSYLYTLLGFYDLFFAQILSKDHHRELQRSIMGLLRNPQ